MKKKGLEDVQVEGTRVIVRVDFNVPLDNSGFITDDSRIKASLATIMYLRERGARVILCSHLGRPNGKVIEELRMTPIVRRLTELLDYPVMSIHDCIGPEVKAKVNSLENGDVLLLENLRFHPEEKDNDPHFAQELAGLAEVYINDAFGTAHRAHASTVGIAKYLPSAAGILMKKELEVMGKALESPEHPFITITGGAKVKDKLALLINIVNKVDTLIIGGRMVSAFLKAQGYPVSDSVDVDGNIEPVLEIISRARERGIPLLLPSDVLIVEGLDNLDTIKEVTIDKIPNGWKIVDIGPDTTSKFCSELDKCQTVVWNGPLGIFEIPQLSKGTEAIARKLASLKATTIIGGGSTAEVVEKLDLTDKMTHVSTGGGASLMFLEGRELPGVAALQDK